MHPIIDLYSSAYVTATGLNIRRRPSQGDDFSEFDCEVPATLSLLSRTVRCISRAISGLGKHSHEPGRVTLPNRSVKI